MPNALPSAATAPPVVATDNGTLRHSGSSIRLTRVLLVSLGLFAMFFAIEHDTSVAGRLPTINAKEGKILDKFVDDIEGGSSKRKAALLLYAAFGIAAFLKCQDRKVNLRILPSLLFLALLAWALCSFFWSDDPALTFKRLIVAACTVIGSAGCARLLKPSELLLVALITLTAFISNSFLLDVMAGARPWSGDYRFGGTVHPNVQAAYCSALCIAAYCLPVGFGKRWITRGLFLFGFGMIILTASRTSLFTILVTLVLVFLLRLKSRIRWIVISTSFSAVALSLIVFSSLNDGQRNQLTGAALMGRTEQSGSLSGRVPLWQELALYSAQRPLTGYGYDNFWTPERIAAVMKTQGWAIQNSHNAYFDIVLQLGLIGLALAVPFILLSWNYIQAAYAQTRDAGYAFIYGMVAFGLTSSFLESMFVKVKYPTILALIGVFMAILFDHRTIEQQIVGAGNPLTTVGLDGVHAHLLTQELTALGGQLASVRFRQRKMYRSADDLHVFLRSQVE